MGGGLMQLIRWDVNEYLRYQDSREKTKKIVHFSIWFVEKNISLILIYFDLK